MRPTAERAGLAIRAVVAVAAVRGDRDAPTAVGASARLKAVAAARNDADVHAGRVLLACVVRPARGIPAFLAAAAS